MSYRFPYMIAQMFLLYAQYNAYTYGRVGISIIFGACQLPFLVIAYYSLKR